jgi:hypothetical protein
MRLVADKVIKDHQTCSIRGRYVYLLTLKEIENPSPQTPVLTGASAASTSIDNEQSDNLVHHDEISSLNSTHSVEEIHQQHHATNGSSSRRTSYIGGKLIFRF